MTMQQRKFRVSDEVWLRAVARADSEGTNVSALLRQFLTDYANHKAASPLAEARLQALREILR